MPVKKGDLKSRLLLGIGVLWLVGVAFGLKVMLTYESQPATPGSAPEVWPVASKIQRSPGLPTIVVMAHPHCPCTRATVGELSILMTKLQKRATATVVFVKPDGVPQNWELTDLWRDAKAIPGVSVMIDPGGKEAELFGALASGQTMLYDAHGKLLFSGGITAGRGHSGDNAGRSTIAELVLYRKSDLSSTPVFGCYLGNPKTREQTQR